MAARKTHSEVEKKCRHTAGPHRCNRLPGHTGYHETKHGMKFGTWDYNMSPEQRAQALADRAYKPKAKA